MTAYIMITSIPTPAPPPTVAAGGEGAVALVALLLLLLITLSPVVAARGALRVRVLWPSPAVQAPALRPPGEP